MSKANRILLIFSAITLIVGVRLEVIDLFGVQTPYWDGWGIGGYITEMYFEGFEFDRLFRAGNEHRMTFNRIISLGLFELNHRQWNPIVWMISNSLVWAASGAFLLSVILNNAPSNSRTLLSIATIAVWAMPFALVNILWGVQTHTYTMVLFSIMGIWWTTDRPLSIRWFLGIASLCAATLTLAGGTFASASVIGVSLLIIISGYINSRSNINHKDYFLTAAGALIPAVLGLTLIAILPRGSEDREFILIDAITTFLKTMSWPDYKGLLPAFAFAAPILFLIVQIFKHNETPSRFTRFILSVYGFIAIVAMAVAYARGVGGPSPAPRYFEFLSLIPLSSLMAICVLSSGAYRTNSKPLAILVSAFLIALASGIPHQVATVDYTIKEQRTLKPIQTLATSRYLNTQNYEEIEEKPFRHIPFDRPEIFQKILDKIASNDALPPSLQPQPHMQWSPEITIEEQNNSAFLRNGTSTLHEGVFGSDHFGEPAYGSFNPEKGKEEATGRFESATIRINRPFAEISYVGDINASGINLYFEDIGNGKKFIVKPTAGERRYGRKYPEMKWLTAELKIPRGYYKIVAEDYSEEAWLAFGSPRPMGRLSYYAKRLTSHGHWIWQLTLLLILWCFRREIVSVFDRRNEIAAKN